MAITNNGTKVSLGTKQLPSGYSLPSITEITGAEYERELSLNVPKATVENATEATTLTNIIDDAAVGITKQVDDILAADFLGTATIEAHADFYGLTTNLNPPTTDSDLFNNSAVNYVCNVKLYVKST